MKNLLTTYFDQIIFYVDGYDGKALAKNNPPILTAQLGPACQSATLSSRLARWEEYFTPWDKLQNKAVGFALLGDISFPGYNWGNVPPIYIEKRVLY